MSQSFESDDIQLNANRFIKKKKTFRVALLVSKHAEKRRAEYRINEMQGVFPESEIQAIKSKGPLTEIYYSTKFWSDYIPWYEWFSESDVLRLCADESGLEIWELAEFIADELKPKNELFVNVNLTPFENDFYESLWDYSMKRMRALTLRLKNLSGLQDMNSKMMK